MRSKLVLLLILLILIGKQGACQVSEKSKAKAFFFSFLLPGAGQLYAEAKGRAKISLVSEAILWSLFFSFRTYGNWLRNDYLVFAATHAGVDISGKDKDYFANLSAYPSIYEYNEEMRRQRRSEEIYPLDSHFWQWDNRASRLKYDQIRTSSERAYNRATLMIGGILLNHILSAIDALWAAHRYNKRQQPSNVRIHIETNLPTEVSLSLVWRF